MTPFFISAVGLGQRQEALVRIATGGASFADLTRVVSLQRLEEIRAHATLDDLGLHPFIRCGIDWFERQAWERGVGIEAGQQGC